jgi:DNA mismatch repair protein MutS2
MNPHGLSVLEFPRLLELIAARAASAAGAARVLALTPTTDRPWLDREHARVAAVRAMLHGDLAWSPEPVPELEAPLRKLRVAGAGWTGVELLGGAQLLRSSRLTREALADERRPAVVAGVLAPLANRLIVARAEEDALHRALQDDGTVRDDASPALRRLRSQLRAAHGELVRILEKAMARLEEHHRVADMSVTVRNGRYVIPVRREGRGALGGIVHDASSTGATLFVEPPAAIEFGNRIRELEAEEFEEVDRILRELTDRLRPLREELADSLDVLAELDSLYARARFAHEFHCAPARLVPSRQGFALLDARHPLLVAQAAEEGRAVVPFDLEMGSDERTLLVSGPNTGGKTVLLKAVGLCSAMVQSGIPAPVHAESRVPLFDDVLADVGDEQSIQASLSTFSAHLRNLSEILRLSTADSLVLVDELGSGTDPVEGAALGWAVLEELTRRGTTTIATTHIGTLKELPAQAPGVVNASLQFDAVQLAPTYRLIKGVPGRSYGISIARRLALPEHVVARAEERLPQQERDLAALVERLEAKEAELAARESEAETIADDARRRIAEVIRREKTVREREREAEKRGRDEARRYLLDARKEIDRTIKDLKRKGEAELEEAAREARRKAEQLAAAQNEQLDRLEREERNAQRREQLAQRGATRAPAKRETVEAGDAVLLETLGGKRGRVVDVRGAEAVVAVGVMKLTVPLHTLRRTSEPEPQERAVVLVGDIPDVEASTEVDLRGMRFDEAETAVYGALDAAIRADLPSLRIIHGKGTGALRELVTEMLRRDTRVRTFRLGAWNEGGAGVTIADLT